jgi:hypothetical protein
MNQRQALRTWLTDRRFRLISAALASIAVIGYGVSLLPSRGVDAEALKRQAGLPASVTEDGAGVVARTESARPYEYLADPRLDPEGHVRQARTNAVSKNLAEARTMLEAKNFDAAVRALNRVLALQPGHPEAHTRMGFALIGRGQYVAAGDHFMHAIDLDPYQADAYFGIAIVQEAAGNLEGAIGGMRNFLHVTDDPDPGRLQVAQARAAIWEWEAQLGRGAWGPTRGVPPGFTAEELRRDGKGVAIKMPVGKPEPGATPNYEIRAGEPKRVFER